ncbi:MAG: hypothetical protein ABIQ35_01810 [Verrucomicrobiota bacterium]
MTTTWFNVRQLPALLRGDTITVRPWSNRASFAQTMVFLAVIVVGTGAFGAAVGFWRAPLQSVYTAIKLPLVIVFTTLGNALLNGMLAPLLGLNIGFRQSLLLILMSFVIASAILGSFSPIVLFLIWNLPPVSSGANTVTGFYGFMQLVLAGIIAFAGVMANWRLFPLLHEQAGSRTVAKRVLLSWLVGNLFLGSQVCWMLRPFVGKPDMPLEFLGPGLQQGNFFETIFDNLRDLLVKSP